MKQRARASAPRTAYETADIRAGAVLTAALAVLVTLGAVLALLLPWRQEPAAGPPPAQPGAALLTDPVANLARFRAGKAGQLQSYGWVDAQAGVAHIPVERAIELLIAQHQDSAGAAPQEHP
ncbi:MAG: hypothetical protein PVI91_12365 [Gammaproteobacteria bacterium]|jgi:hypothetical protein